LQSRPKTNIKDFVEPYILKYPGGTNRNFPSVDLFAFQLRKSAEQAGDKLDEFRKLNEPMIMGRINAEDPEMASRLMDSLL
jgi:hypothetical protein